MSIIEEIQERSKNLPEPLAKEVLDFLIFVTNRNPRPDSQDQLKWERIQSQLGKVKLRGSTASWQREVRAAWDR